MKKFEWNGLLKLFGVWFSIIKRYLPGTGGGDDFLIDTSCMQKKTQKQTKKLIA